MARRWTEEEKSYVEEYWGAKSVKAIAKKINRTESAVMNYAERNKLGSMYREVYLLPPLLGEYFGVSESTIKTWIKDFGLPSNTRPLKKHRAHRILPEKLLIWCRDNQSKWSSKNLPIYALGEEPAWLVEKRKKDLADNTYKAREWTTKEISQLLELVDSGMSNPQIAKIMNRSEYSIKRQRTKQLHKRRELLKEII